MKKICGVILKIVFCPILAYIGLGLIIFSQFEYKSNYVFPDNVFGDVAAKGIITDPFSLFGYIIIVLFIIDLFMNGELIMEKINDKIDYIVEKIK